MKTKTQPHIYQLSGVANAENLIALSFDLSADKDGYVQLTPDGVFKAQDGRPKGLDGFVLNPTVAKSLIATLQASKNDIVIDYEHQTLYSEQNGQPAPASGWIKRIDIKYKQNVGMVAKVKWTSRAAEKIKGDEYRFISPVLEIDPVTGEILDIYHVALTNLPGLDGMRKAEAFKRNKSDKNKSSTEHTSTTQEKVMLEELIKLLGLKEDATQDEVVDAIKSLIGEKDTVAELRTQLGVDAAADIKAAVVALKANAEPDPAKYTEVGVVEALKNEIAEIKGKQVESEAEALVELGFKQFKLYPEQRDWALRLAKKDLGELQAYLDGTPAIEALRSRQTEDVNSPDTNTKELSEAQKTVYKQLGISTDKEQK